MENKGFNINTIGTTAAFVFGSAVATVSLFELLSYIKKKLSTPQNSNQSQAKGYLVANIIDQNDYSINARILPTRGMRWFNHMKWNIPSLTRDVNKRFHEVDDIVTILQAFEVDPARGFLPPKDPIERLHQEKYFIWEDVADELSKFLGVRFPQVREVLLGLPLLSTADLQTREDLYRAHFLLSLFAHAFVFGGLPIVDYIPENIAIPLWEISKRLDVPPLLCYFDIVLHNWRRLDDKATISMANLATLNNFFDGRDESWFYLITVEIEVIGAEAIVPLYQSNRDIKNFKARNRSVNPLAGSMTGYESRMDDCNSKEFWELIEAISHRLQCVAVVVASMTRSLAQMREGCDPYIFFHRVRPFLAGWKSNPAVPNGVRYLGVKERWEDRNKEEVAAGSAPPRSRAISDESAVMSVNKDHQDVLYVNSENDKYPFQSFSGGSAAQSPVIPFLDIALGVDHSAHDASSNSNRFLHSMRSYMIKSHREFLEHCERESFLREFVLECENCFIKQHSSSLNYSSQFSSPLPSPQQIKDITKMIVAYDTCLKNLSLFRTGHINLVAEYIMAQQKNGISKNAIHATAGGKGTGGTNLMQFLKPIRDNVSNTVTGVAADASDVASASTNADANETNALNCH